MTAQVAWNVLRSTSRSSCGMLALLALAAGCGGNGAAGDASVARAEVDPCALVTAAEAEQVLRAAPAAERPSEANNDFLATCRYVAPRGASVAVLVVSVSRQSGQYAFDTARRMGEEGIPIEALTGLGDDAFWVDDPLHTLYVLRGTTYFSIGGDVQLEQARPLASRALERLR